MITNCFLSLKTAIPVLLLISSSSFSSLQGKDLKRNVQSENKSILETTDHVIVVRNNSVVFDYLQTEEEFGSPVSIRVIEQPKFGDVTLNEDQSFEYAPLQNLCEKDDIFVYQMTIGEQTTEVSVSIEILCESITIFNSMGAAPQKESKAPTNFTILGLENFPNNSLYVFDDAGQQVYQKKGYENDWDGTIEETKKLEEDRMYYYVFTDGGGTYYSGYLQIN